MKLKLTFLLGTAALSVVLAGQAADSASDSRPTKADQRSQFKPTAYSAKVYRSFGVAPYWAVDADNTARIVRDREDHRLTPLNQGTSDADVETTRLIRKEIVGREGLSVNAHNVKVITLNGIVTLRGPVNNAEEKLAIGEIAGRFAKEQNVINQLDVKEQP